MKIAFIGQKGIPVRIGGVERRVEEVSTRMAKIGHDVFVYVRNNYTEKHIGAYRGVKLIHLPTVHTKNLDAIVHTFLATIHAIFQRYDIVHYQAPGPSSLCWLMKMFAPRTAVVATFNCRDDQQKKWGFFARLYLRFGEKIVCTMPDKTIVAGKTLHKYVFETYGKNHTMIVNGASIRKTSKSNRLAQWGLERGKYIFIVSRFIRHKGVHYVTESFENLQKTGKLPSGMKLMIIGEGMHTDDYVQFLRDRVQKNENIILEGPQGGETLAQLYTHAALFVQPSDMEGLSNALLEAMGYGLPILASDIAENKEAVSGCSMLFRAGDVSDLTEKLYILLHNTARAQKLGMRARQHAQNEYSWDTNTDKTLEVYSTALEDKRSRQGFFAKTHINEKIS